MLNALKSNIGCFLSPKLNSGPMYENIPGQLAEQEDHQYSRLHFSKNPTEDLYSTLNPDSVK